MKTTIIGNKSNLHTIIWMWKLIKPLALKNKSFEDTHKQKTDSNNIRRIRLCIPREIMIYLILDTQGSKDNHNNGKIIISHIRTQVHPYMSKIITCLFLLLLFLLHFLFFIVLWIVLTSQHTTFACLTCITNKVIKPRRRRKSWQTKPNQPN